jgi:tetrahydromethanopterin S-methyltransferase subunit F
MSTFVFGFIVGVVVAGIMLLIIFPNDGSIQK